MPDGWDSLLNIYRAARRNADAVQSQPPVACPNDGEPLREDLDGKLHCQFDGWIWDGLPIRY